jgi:hypothetical protein
MSPFVARSCGPEMSALAPLLGDKQTSGKRVESDANDPTTDVRRHCTISFEVPNRRAIGERRLKRVVSDQIHPCHGVHFYFPRAALAPL